MIVPKYIDLLCFTVRFDFRTSRFDCVRRMLGGLQHHDQQVVTDGVTEGKALFSGLHAYVRIQEKLLLFSDSFA